MAVSKDTIADVREAAGSFPSFIVSSAAARDMSTHASMATNGDANRHVQLNMTAGKSVSLSRILNKGMS